MKIRKNMLFAVLAMTFGIGAGISNSVSALPICNVECRNRYNACLTACSTSACRTLCFYNYENCIDGCTN